MNAQVRRWAQAAGSNRRLCVNLVAGLIPRAVGVTDPDMARALDEREITMQRRARELAERRSRKAKPGSARLAYHLASPSPGNVGCTRSRPSPPTGTDGTSPPIT